MSQPIRLLTWNVNSIRARIEHLAAVIDAVRPTVICLQETKATATQFPAERLRELGYPHQALRGEKGRNGVAILADRPFAEQWHRTWWGQDDARHIAVTLADAPATEIHCFYVPSGGPEPDTEANPKFAHKLGFIDEMRQWAREAASAGRAVAVLGDLNIAPLETDVWNHKRIKRQVGHTPRECERLLDLRDAGGFTDVGRAFVPPENFLFTWWGYRHPGAFEKDYGWRLDHVWVTAPLAAGVTGHRVVSRTRGWERPSDHAPVMVDLIRVQL